VSPEDDELIPAAWQLPIKVNSNLITLININLKTVILKIPGNFVNKSLVWLKAIKLVYNSCPR
jgi:hypothetical protein